jgi:hypothetical protein
MNGCPSPATEGSSLPVWRIAEWLEHIDPGTHRRIKGLRLVTAYGIAALLGRLPEFSRGLSNGAWLRFLAAGFALWASVSEARTTRAESTAHHGSLRCPRSSKLCQFPSAQLLPTADNAPIRLPTTLPSSV